MAWQTFVPGLASLGDAVSAVGTVLNLPEMGISEKLNANALKPASTRPAGIYTNGLGATSQAPTTNEVAPTGAVTGGTSGGTSGGGTAGPSPAQLQAVRDAYAQKRGTLQGFMDLVPQQQNQAIGSVNRNYTGAANALENSKNVAQSGLNQAKQSNTDNRQRSFEDIAMGIRNSVDAFRNRLGTVGAADSSAAYVTAPYAFAQLQAQQRGDVSEVYNQNQNDIKLKEQEVMTEFTNQKNSIDLDYQNKIGDIATKFNDLKTSLWQQMQDANAEEQAALAQYGQTAAQQALMSISQLNQTWQANTSQLEQQASQFLSAFKPNITTPVLNQQDFSTYGQQTPGSMDNVSNAQDAMINVLPTKKDNLGF